MQFINKRNRKNRKQGHAIVKSFIRSQWQKDSSRYIGLDYDTFKSNGKFKKLLLREQNNLCCYCMRHLTIDSKLTLEHVVPHNYDLKGKEIKKKLKEYAKYGCLNRKHIFWGHHINKKKKLETPPYPHFIAYENLVASCNGSIDANQKGLPILHKCCNNFRGNKDIIPLFYLENISSNIKYFKDGELDYPDRYQKTIDIIKIEHSTLKSIRKIWAILAKDFEIKEIESAIQDQDLRQQIIDDYNLESKFNKPFYWKLLYEYKWFYSYFKSQ